MPADSQDEVHTRRVEILDAAAKLFNSRGVSQTSLQELGDLVGVTRNALYYHFEDREDLLFHTYIRSCEIFAAHLAEAMKAGGSAIEVLESFILRALDPTAPEAASLNEHELLSPAKFKVLTARFDTLANDLAEVISRGAETKELRPCHYDTAARTIISILHSIPLWNISLSSRASERSLVGAAFCDLLRRGWATDRQQRLHPPTIDISPLIVRADGFDKQSLELRKRETILSVASRIFNQRGVGATKLEDIAAALNVSKQQLYRYFASKRELVSACFERSGKIYGFIVAAALAAGGSPHERLMAVLQTNAYVQQHDELQPLHYATAIGSLSRQEQDQARKWRRENAVEYTHLFEEGARLGELRLLDLRTLTYLVSGANLWLVKGQWDKDDASKARRAEEVYAVLRIGLLAF